MTLSCCAFNTTTFKACTTAPAASHAYVSVRVDTMAVPGSQAPTSPSGLVNSRELKNSLVSSKETGAGVHVLRHRALVSLSLLHQVVAKGILIVSVCLHLLEDVSACIPNGLVTDTRLKHTAFVHKACEHTAMTVAAFMKHSCFRCLHVDISKLQGGFHKEWIPRNLECAPESGFASAVSPARQFQAGRACRAQSAS